MRQPRKNSMTEAVLDCFGYKPKTAKEIADKLGLTYEQAIGCCRNLVKYHKLERVASGTYKLRSQARKPRKNSATETVFNAIGYEPITISELADKTGLTYEQVSGCCHSLMTFQKIKRVAHGTYQQINGGEEFDEIFNKTATQRVYEALSYEPIKIKDLASKLNLPYDRVSACCHNLMNRGEIERTAHGRYRLTMQIKE